MSASPRPAPSQIPLIAAAPHRQRAGSRAALPSVAAWVAQVLAGWHLLSLDAPTVAALWVVFIAHSARVALPWTDPAAMFLAVWSLYAADRLLDARSLSSRVNPGVDLGVGPGVDSGGLEARHHFHHRHRAWFYAGLALACPLLVLLLRFANPSAFRLDLVLGGLLFAWLLLIHARPGSWSRLPKELAVGVFFPAAVFIPSVARQPGLRPELLPCAVLFAAACSLNCLYIFAWEHPHRADAHWSTRWAIQRLPHLTAATVLASLGVATFFAYSPHRLLALPALACAGSAALLWTLHARRHALSSLTLRAAADLCLLTPALLLPALAPGRIAAAIW